MAQRWGRRLYELPQFRGLSEVGRHFRVDFSLFGGVASRIAMVDYGPKSAVPRLQGLADLSPFVSDIDLEHSGDDALTPAIARAIDEVVPEAAWCRWSIVGRGASAKLARRRRRSHRIPLRSIRLDSWRDSLIPDDAYNDLVARRVSLVLNPRFGRGGSAIEDLELFAGLLALATAQDLASSGGERPHVEEVQLLELVRRSQARNEQLLAQAAWPLKRRLRYLLAPLSARLSDPVSGAEAQLLAYASAGLRDDPAEGVLLISSALADGRFRLPTSAPIDVGRDGLGEFLGELTRRGFELDPVFELDAVTQALPMQTGLAPSSGRSVDGSIREFVHLAWRRPVGARPAHLAGFVWPADGSERPLARGAATGGLFPNGISWARIDIGALLDQPAPASLRIAIIGAAIGDPIDEEGPVLIGGGGPSVTQYADPGGALARNRFGGEVRAQASPFLGEARSPLSKLRIRRSSPGDIVAPGRRDIEDEA